MEEKIYQIKREQKALMYEKNNGENEKSRKSCKMDSTKNQERIVRAKKW